MNIAIQYWKSPVGELIIGVYNNQICLCDWRYRKMRNAIDIRIQKALKLKYTEEKHDLHSELIKQLQEYFSKERQVFDLPLLLIGTEFQKNIWNLLLEIPFGKTFSYKDLAIKYGDVKVVRALATANGANAMSIIIPCHRVIGAKGNLVGYAGGLSAKQKLLSLEKSLNEQQNLLF